MPANPTGITACPSCGQTSFVPRHAEEGRTCWTCGFGEQGTDHDIHAKASELWLKIFHQTHEKGGSLEACATAADEAEQLFRARFRDHQ